MKKNFLLFVMFLYFSSAAMASPPVPFPEAKPHLVSVNFGFPAGYQTTQEGEFKVVAYLEAKEDIKKASFNITATESLQLDLDLPQYSGGMLKGQRFHMKISGRMKNVEDLFESLTLRIIYGEEPHARRIARTLSIQAGSPSLIPPEGLKQKGSLSEATFTDWMMYSITDKESILNEAFEKRNIKVKNEPEKLIHQLKQMYTHCDDACKAMNIVEVLENLDYIHILK